MAYEFADRGNYDSLNCESQNLKPICEEADKNYGVRDGKEPIIALNRHQNSNSACIYSPLNHVQGSGWFYDLKDKFQEKTKTWYCTDSSGNAGETKIDPGSAGYCVDGVSAKCPPTFD
ncbi:MAG: hypothetical protein PHE77_02790 [Candidatus Pacebacteria bacterium]|nr:hypothetical protein [Candidatus Paceibacterota bacterium]